MEPADTMDTKSFGCSSRLSYIPLAFVSLVISDFITPYWCLHTSFHFCCPSCSEMTKVHIAFLILSRGLYGNSSAIIHIETRMNFLQSCLNGVLKNFKHGSNLLSGFILAGKTILKFLLTSQNQTTSGPVTCLN